MKKLRIYQQILFVCFCFLFGSIAEEAFARGGRGGRGGGGGRSGSFSPGGRSGSMRPTPRPAPRPSRPSTRPNPGPSRQPSLRPSPQPGHRPVNRPSTRPVTRPSRPGVDIPSHRPSRPGVNPPNRPNRPNRPGVNPPNRPGTLPNRPGVRPPNRPGIDRPNLPNRPGIDRPDRPNFRPPHRPGDRPNTLPGHRPGNDRPHNYLPGRYPGNYRPGVHPHRHDRINHARNNLYRHRHYFGSDWYRYHPHARFYWRNNNYWINNPFMWVTTASLVSWLGYPNYYNYNSSGYADYSVDNSTIYYGSDTSSDAYYQEYYGSAESLAQQGNIAVGSQEEQDDLVNAEWTSIGIYGVVPVNEEEAVAMIELYMTKQGIISGNYVDLGTNQTYALYGSVDTTTMKVSIAADIDNSPVIETNLAALSQADSIATMFISSQTAISVNLVKAPEKEQ